MSQLKTLLPLLLLAVLVGGQVIFRNGDEILCRETPKMKNFDLRRFMGRWNVTRMYNKRLIYDLTCVYWEFTIHGEDGFNLVKYGIITDHPGKVGDIFVRRYRAIPFHPKGGPVSKTSFQLRILTARSYIDINSGYPEPDLRILDSDYTGYAIVYACRNLTEERHERELYVLTRSETVNQTITSLYENKLVALGMNKDPVILKKADLNQCNLFRSGKYKH